MESSMVLDISPQPDGTTCGPTCLHAVYRYFGDDIPLETVVAEVGTIATGGTLAVLLACHALRRGYQASIYTYNLQVFDPTWFSGGVNPTAKLLEQREAKGDPRLHEATEAYLQFLSLGGRLRFRDLTPKLVRTFLKKKVPVLAGCSATYLYGCPREIEDRYDDVRGDSCGHFVVLSGYDRETRTVSVSDPLPDNPLYGARYYRVRIERILNSILLGIGTYDANFLVIRPRSASPR